MCKTVAILLVVAAVGSAQVLPWWPGNWGAWGNWAPAPVRTLPVAAAPVPVAAAAAPLPWTSIAPAFSASQYHAQDELGQASFGYSHPGQAAANFRDAFGNQRGSWSYVDNQGKLVVVNYIADANGFRVLSNNLPEAPVANLVAPLPVQDTPEVAAARAAHLAALRAAEANDGAVPVPIDLPVPVAVQETQEVAAARAEHLRLWTEAKERSEQA